MMYQMARFRYRHDPEDQVQLLEMPYRGHDITMVIVLPSKGTALRQVRSSCLRPTRTRVDTLLELDRNVLQKPHLPGRRELAQKAKAAGTSR